MRSSVVRTFTDPDIYFAGIPNLQVIGLVTQRGKFRADLTCIDLHGLWMHRFNENLPQIIRVTPRGKRAQIIFQTDADQPAILANGMEMSQNQIAQFGLRWDWYLRSSAGSRWGAISLTSERLAAAARTIAGRKLTPPTFMHLARPCVSSFSGLLKLHEVADDLAKTAPDILEKPEVARALEQNLVEAMVLNLAGGRSDEVRNVHRQRARVMQRLDDTLEERSNEPLYMGELCEAVGATYWTLRECCLEYLGMSPKRYLWMRRMNLARRALRGADSKKTTVTEVATNYGFWELGRFSVAYRSLFGESPSAALRRQP